MSSNRVKIDINDNDGNKITISLQGRLTKDKVLQLLDFVDLLGGPSTITDREKLSTLSKFDKLKNVLLTKFPLGWFTSQEVMQVYEDVIAEPIGLSTVSTYLSRLVAKGMLMKSGSKANRRYKIVSGITNNNSRYKIST